MPPRRGHISLIPRNLAQGPPNRHFSPKKLSGGGWEKTQGPSGKMANALSTKELIDQNYITEEK